MDMVQVSVEFPRNLLSTLRQEPATFVDEMRLAAEVKWYELQMLSQAKAAEVAGISRSEFLTALARFDVTPFQYESAGELITEVNPSTDISIEQDPLWNIVGLGSSGVGDMSQRHDEYLVEIEMRANHPDEEV